MLFNLNASNLIGGHILILQFKSRAMFAPKIIFKNSEMAILPKMKIVSNRNYTTSGHSLKTTMIIKKMLVVQLLFLSYKDLKTLL